MEIDEIPTANRLVIEEIDQLDVPVSDFSAGLAVGIGFGLGILALMGC